MGVRGAAIATVISRIAELIILVSMTYIKKYAPAGRLRELFSFDLIYAGRFFRIALPVIVNEMLWSLGVTCQNIIFARTSTEAIAAFNITSTIYMLTWVLFVGLGNSVAVMIGKKIGERDEQTARDYASRIIRFSPLMGIAAAVLLYPISLILPFIFNVNPETLLTASRLFIIFCCIYPFRAFNNTLIIGICRAGGDTLFCAIYESVTMWLFALPLAALAAFVLRAPVWLIFICMMSEHPVKAAIGFLRYRSGKWLHYVTESKTD